MSDDTQIPQYLPLTEAEPKPWYRSRGVIGSLAVVISQSLLLAGLSVDANALTEVFLAGAGFLSGLIALWGRVRAQQPIATRKR